MYGRGGSCGRCSLAAAPQPICNREQRSANIQTRGPPRLPQLLHLIVEAVQDTHLRPAAASCGSPSDGVGMTGDADLIDFLEMHLVASSIQGDNGAVPGQCDFILVTVAIDVLAVGAIRGGLLAMQCSGPR
jgi:hypothetical protein